VLTQDDRDRGVRQRRANHARGAERRRQLRRVERDAFETLQEARQDRRLSPAQVETLKQDWLAAFSSAYGKGGRS
jgi:hypothetical protein